MITIFNSLKKGDYFTYKNEVYRKILNCELENDKLVGYANRTTDNFTVRLNDNEEVEVLPSCTFYELEVGDEFYCDLTMFRKNNGVNAQSIESNNGFIKNLTYGFDSSREVIKVPGSTRSEPVSKPKSTSRPKVIRVIDKGVMREASLFNGYAIYLFNVGEELNTVDKVPYYVNNYEEALKYLNDNGSSNCTVLLEKLVDVIQLH